MDSDVKCPSGCAEVRALLCAFLQNEIAADESRRVQEHLDACPPCARHLRLEEAFDGALRRGLGREAASPSLVLAIHDSLRAEDASVGRRLRAALAPGWRRWAAAAALLAAVAIPSLLVLQGGGSGSGGAALAGERVLEGVLVCSGCERIGVPANDQRGCRRFGHHTAFRCPKTGLWEFVDSEVTHDLLADQEHLGKRVEVRAVPVGDLHYLRVKSFRFIEVGPPDAG